MPRPSLSDDNELPGNDPHLTEAERAAREGFDDDGNEIAAADASAGAATAAPPAAGDGAAPPADPAAAVAPTNDAATAGGEGDAAAAPAASAASATTQAEAPSAPTSTHVAGPVFAPRLDPGAPRDFDAELNGLKEKYAAGDLDDDAYMDAREKVVEARTIYNARSTIAEEISQRGWEANVHAFLQLPENATLLRSDALRDFWSAAMTRFVNEASSSGKSPSDWEILSGGRDKLFQEMGISTAPIPPAPTPTNPTGAPAQPPTPPPVRAPDLTGVPPAVGSAPNAGATGAKTTAESLAGQDIFQIEAFMAGQSEEQQEAILRTLPGAFADT